MISKHAMICGNCKKGIRFYIDKLPNRNDIIKADGVTHPDGSKPNEGDKIPPCPECGIEKITISSESFEDK